MTNDNQPPDEPPWVRTVADVPMYVGMVANEWNKLENYMPLILAPLLGSSADVARVTLFAMNPASRRDYLHAILTFPPWSELSIKDDLIKYIKEYDRLRALRNDIVHGVWEYQFKELTKDMTPVLKLVKGRKEPKESIEPKEKSFIIQVVNDIQKLNIQTFDLALPLQNLRDSMRK